MTKEQDEQSSAADHSQLPPLGRSDLPPWLLAELDSLLALYDAGNLHHALLLTGRSGIGKRVLTMALARGLLCQAGRASRDGGKRNGGKTTKAEPRPCGECRACRLTGNENHPDMRLLGPHNATERGEIVVDSVRGLVDFLHLSPHYGGSRVAVIVPCDRLNVAAANSLLKTLEEPPTGVFLILTTGRPGRLPATVRSRCTVRQLASPSLEAAQQWLAGQHNLSAERLRQALVMCGGMPLSADTFLRQHGVDRLDLLLQQLHRISAGGDPIKEAETWQNNPQMLAEALAAVLAELLRRRHSGSMLGLMPEPLAHRLADSVPLEKLHKLFEQITDFRRHLEQPLQGRLAAEAIFIDLAKTLTLGSMPVSRGRYAGD